jgi:hypothetical protein
MTNFNFLSKTSSQSCGHNVVTLAATVGSPSAHRRGIMLKLISVLVLILTFGVGNVWGTAVDKQAVWTFTSTSYPSNNTNFGATSGVYATNSNFKITNTSTGWKDGSRFKFTTSSTAANFLISVKATDAIPVGTKVTLKMTVWYNKANNAPVKNLGIKVSTNGSTYNTTGVGTTSWTLSNSSTEYSCEYTTQTALAANTTIYFELTGSNRAGQGEGYCSGASITIPIESTPSCNSLTMTEVTATPLNGQIALSWPAVTNASSYTVSCKVKSSGAAAGTAGSVTGTTTKSCTISGLSNGVEYTWSVEPVGSGTYCSSNTPATGDETPNQYYTVTWNNQGEEVTSTSVASGQKPTFPDMSSESGCGKYTHFYGWAEGTWSGEVESPTKSSTVKVYTSANDMPAVTSDGVVYNAVWGDQTSGWAETTTLAEGDVIVLVNTSSKAELTSIGLINTTTCGKTTTYQTSPAGTFPLSVEKGYNNTGLSFKNGSNYLYYSGSSNDINTSTSKTANSSWTCEYSAGDWSITNNAVTGRRIRYNSSSPRFCCYTSAQTSVQIYKYTSNAKCVTSCCTPLGSINGSVF